MLLWHLIYINDKSVRKVRILSAPIFRTALNGLVPSLTCVTSFQWFDLEETPTGKLHLKLEWLSLLSTPEKLDQVKYWIVKTTKISLEQAQVYAGAHAWSFSVVTTITTCFVHLVQSGAAKCASRQKPGQWRPIISSAGGLSGLSQEPASKKLHFGVWMLLFWRFSFTHLIQTNVLEYNIN